MTATLAETSLTEHARLERLVDDDAARIDSVLALVRGRLATAYGIESVYADVPEPFTGDLDGQMVYIDNDLGPEDALFILCHLGAHCVQWSTSAEERAIGLYDVRRRPEPPMLAALMEYEAKAARYALQLLHDVGVHWLDQWLADFAACDLRYLFYFYCTGEQRPFHAFWLPNTTPIMPLAIPDFQAQKWASRAGTVI